MRLAEFIPFFNRRLEQFLDGLPVAGPLKEVVSYTPLSGGKRLRAYLIWELSKVTAFGDENSMAAGMAVELFHSGSLIHDDLPEIDNDSIRRGQPSSHVKFGECKAILAGDYLMLLPQRLLSSLNLDCDFKQTLIKLWHETSLKVVEGEFEDVFPQERSREQMERIHAAKTGALFGFCFAAPFVVESEQRLNEMHRLGLKFGKLFQFLDDIKDVTSTERELGKTPGKDGIQDKLTILSFESIESAQSRVEGMFHKLLEEISVFTDLKSEMVEIYDLITRR